MVLSEDLQRDLHHEVRQVEEDVRALVRRMETALPFTKRRAVRVVLAKLEVLVSGLEDLLFPDEGVDAEIETLNQKSDELIMARAELEREARKIRREGDRVALDRRALNQQHAADELAAIERRVGPLG